MIPIEEQIEEVERQIRSLERYPGRMTAETVARKLAHLRAASATLRIIAEHKDGLRTLLAYLRREAASEEPAEHPDAEDTAALLAHPAVAAVVAAFPEAVLLGIEAVASPAPHEASEEREHEEAA
jgi:hypothetical protein